MTLDTLTYYASLFKNDLHFIHWHAAGKKFDKIHSISQELYEELEDELDELAELAIIEGCKVNNMTAVKSSVGEEQWEPQDKECYSWEEFTEILNELGTKYIDAIKDTECGDGSKSYLDEIERFWEKEILYKNAARDIECNDDDSDYVDASEEAKEDDEDFADSDFTKGFGDDDKGGFEYFKTGLEIAGGEPIEIGPDDNEDDEDDEKEEDEED